MTLDNALFLLARAVMVLLCIWAAFAALRHMRRQADAGGQPAAVLGLAVAMLGLGIALAVHDSWDNVFRDWAAPITLGSWLWLVFDLGVPLLALRVITVMAQRDEALARLSALAVTDSLTGLANRRGFESRGEALVAASRRNGLPCAVLAFDIDRFKSINDGWGHLAGDVVLRNAAAALSAGVRPGDVIGRLGGEEFAALLGGIDARTAAAMAERLRQAVREGVKHPAGDGTAITLSCGVAAVAPGDQPGAALTAALEAADAALYAAKRNGRDRVELAAA